MKKESVVKEAIPLKERPIDIAILVFFWINILFITYIVDIEQLIIKDPDDFSYPIWPPPFFVDIIHEYGRTYDPVQYARPVWWKMTILLDAVFFGPFYVFAIHAYTNGKEWIRVPSLLYSSMLFTNVIIILGEETWGMYASPHLGIVYLLNLPWLVFPIIIVYRMWSAKEGYVFHKKLD